MKLKSTASILKKEYSSYFISPVGYIVMGLYLVLTGWFFFSSFFLRKDASLREFFNLMPMIMAFIVPAITMKAFAEEYKTGSYEMLGTLPVSKLDITLGKFLASWGFILTVLLPTLSYPIFISMIGDMDGGMVFTGYLGAVLLTGAFTAIGILCSTFTNNQIIAFLLGAAVCFLLTIIQNMVVLMPTSVATIVQNISVKSHFNNIGRGVIDSRDLVYFASLIFLPLYATLQRGNK